MRIRVRVRFSVRIRFTVKVRVRVRVRVKVGTSYGSRTRAGARAMTTPVRAFASPCAEHWEGCCGHMGHAGGLLRAHGPRREQ